MKRSVVAVAAAALVGASTSGAAEQPPEPIDTAIPKPVFGIVTAGPFSATHIRHHLRALGPGAPTWATRLYRRSVRVLVALTDPVSGALIAGERDGWDFVWPRDAAAAAIALEAAGLRPEARRVVDFLSRLDLDYGARFHPGGSPVPGRPAAGDASGWVAAAIEAVGGGDGRATPGAARVPASTPGVPASTHPHYDWSDRQDYGENVTGDLLGNAIAAGAPSTEIAARFRTARGLVRQQGDDELDSSAAWAATIFPNPAVRGVVARTLLTLVRGSSRYGIPPLEGWTPGEVWTAPTAWSAWALIVLRHLHAADRLLAELRRAATPNGTLPERVSAANGQPTSTTPLAWSHAFAILALRARYPD